MAQKDSIKAHAFVNIQAMLQSGNLNQFGGNIVGKFRVGNKRFDLGLSGNYNHVTVNGFNIINDSWNYSTLKFLQQRRLYPMTMVYYGFGKSFGIRSASVAGVGGGLNISRASPQKYLSLNLVAGYMAFRFEQQMPQEGFVGNLYATGNTIFKDKLEVNWELHGYYAPIEADAYGISNFLRLMVPLSKELSLTISNQLIYNQRVELGREQLNSITMLGLGLKR